MRDYLAVQRSAHAKILRRGAMATLEWDVPGTPDVVAGTAGTPSTKRCQVALLVLPLSRRQIGADTYEAQTLILQRSRRFDMSALNLPITLRVGMRIPGWEDHTWTIDSVTPLMPDGKTPVMYSGTMKQ